MERAAAAAKVREEAEAVEAAAAEAAGLAEAVRLGFVIVAGGNDTTGNLISHTAALLDACQNMMAKQSPIVATTQEAIAQYSTLMRSGLGAGCPRLYGFRSGCFSIILRSLAPELCD